MRYPRHTCLNWLWDQYYPQREPTTTLLQNGKLKPLATNAYTITYIFQFSQDIRNTSILVNHILVSYDVRALFTNVPAHKTITILLEKAFSDNWFSDTCDLNHTKDQLGELLDLATPNQLFQLNGMLYKQIEGVAMGSPLAHYWPTCSCAL